MSMKAAALQRTLLADDGQLAQANSGPPELNDKGNTMTQIGSLVTERRVMLATISMLVVAMVFMVVATCTDHWAQLHCMPYFHRKHQAYVFGFHTGIWRTCFYTASRLPSHDTHHDTGVTGKTHSDMESLPLQGVVTQRCEMVDFYPSKEEVENNKQDIDYEILNYSRSETAFAIISVLLMAIGLFFSVYCLKEPRYMFKRLAALLHLISAICMLVCAEVFMNSINYEQRNLPKRYPPTTTRVAFGYSFAFVWVAFALDIIACIIYLVLGRKRKRERARSDREAYENEPVVLGRI